MKHYMIFFFFFCETLQDNNKDFWLYCFIKIKCMQGCLAIWWRLFEAVLLGWYKCLMLKCLEKQHFFSLPPIWGIVVWCCSDAELKWLHLQLGWRRERVSTVWVWMKLFILRLRRGVVKCEYVWVLQVIFKFDKTEITLVTTLDCVGPNFHPCRSKF